MTGKYLFDNSIKNEMSLLDYVKVYLNEEKSNLSSVSAGYAATQQVIEFAGTPDRLQSFAFGINNGEVIEGNNTDTELRATSELADKSLANEEDSAKTGEDTRLKDPDKISSLSSDKQFDSTLIKTPVSDEGIEEPADGSVADGDSESNGIGIGKGTTAGQDAASETGGSGDVTAHEEGGSTSKDGTSLVNGTSKGDGNDSNELPDPDFTGGSSSKDKNISSEDATGTGKNKVDAKDNNPSKKSPDVVSYDSEQSNSGSGSNGTSGSSSVADSPATHDMIANPDDGTTDGILIGKGAPSIKNEMEEETEKATDSVDSVTTEKRLMTVYNLSTGTYEIVDMDQFLSAKDYKSENDRLAIRDFGVYGGYATAEKPKDEDQRNGVLLYILVSIALLVGVSGGIYYKKKHKVKI
jgi:hypothetical protein